MKTTHPPRKTTFKHNWTNADLDREVAKLPETVEIYWDRNDELSNEQTARILKEGIEGLNEVEDELWQYHIESLDCRRDEEIEELLASMRKRGAVSDKCERRLRNRIEDAGKLSFDSNLDELARNTPGAYFTVGVGPEINYQAYRGVESAEQVREICRFCELLNINPAHLQVLVSADNDNRPSYDPEPVIFPDHPERDGHEYAAPASLLRALDETSYGGVLVFLLKLDIRDIIKDLRAGRDSYRQGPLRILKGTLAVFYDYNNGAGSCEDIELLKDLVLPAGSYTLSLDASRRYGLQDCYGFTDAPWKRGHTLPLTTNE